MRPALMLLALSLATSVAAGCSDAGGAGGGGSCHRTAAADDEVEPRGISAFGSEEELDGYLASIAQKQKDMTERCSDSYGANAAAPTAAGDDDDSSDSQIDNANITNNQENGVDEGGIVKNIGSALVVLRQGRLYAVDIAGAKPIVTDAMRVARTDALNQDVWYDEMLVKGDLVYTIGYRYSLQLAAGDSASGATEVDTFRVVNGKLTRLRSMFLESSDYYSGHNYASRMVDGRLVFYMPHYVGRGPNGKLAYPRVLEADDTGAFHSVGPIFGALDVFTSLVKPGSPTFHTVVQCDLPESGELACHGRSVLGSWWRESYVSSDALYLWAGSHVYRFDFQSLDIAAHKAAGYPTDQFSFRQSTDGTSLFVASNRAADAKPSLLTLPLAAFDKHGAQPTIPMIPIASTSVEIAQNRFIGDTLLAVTGTYYGGNESRPMSDLVKVDPKTHAVSSLPLENTNVVRIEPLGENRALIAKSPHPLAESLTLQSVSLDDLSKPLGEVSLYGVSQGESRSHGFFFKPAGNGNGGTFGYAVLDDANREDAWGDGISNIGFFDVGESGALTSLGIVSSGDVTTTCETSCTDWYGNTRPIFLGSRVFALMGSELAEVSLRPAATKAAGAELR